MNSSYTGINVEITLNKRFYTPLFMEHKASNQVILGKLTWLKAQYLLNKNARIFLKELKSSK